LPVRGLADDVDALLFEQRLQAAPKEVMVVHHEDADLVKRLLSGQFFCRAAHVTPWAKRGFGF
jgi:hypothetical protein